MATNKQDKVLNIPPLRFPGFTDEWKSFKLSECCSFYSGGTPASGKSEYYGGDIPFIRSGEIHSCNTELSITETGLKSSSAKMVSKGDLLLAMYGATSGEIDISKIDGAINQAILCIHTKQNRYFLKSLWTKHTARLLNTYLQGGQGNLSAEIIRNIKFYFPSILEQEKISKLIIIIDERIATQNKIIEDLKKLKSAIIDKVFCLPTEKQPNKRLYGFYDDWSKVKLSEICERITNKNSDLNCNLVLTIAAQYGLVNQLDFFNKSVASENLSSYYILKKGDFAYNKSYSGEYVWGAIKKLDYYEEGVLSPLYICFRPDQNKISPDFLAFYYESTKWHRGISEIAGEGARNHGLLNISVIDFFNTIHRIPSLLEQIQIATLLQTYQNKINNEERLLLHYQTQRKYLLTNIFI